MVLRCVLLLLHFYSIGLSQVGVQDALLTNKQMQILVYKDGHFSFSKIDDPMKDMLGGDWLLRNDTCYLFSSDSTRLLLFAFFIEDSLHFSLTHTDPRIYDSYAREGFPNYFYLNTVYYDNGAVQKKYSFASCDEQQNHCFLTIQCFSEKGALLYTVDSNLKNKKTWYREWSSESYKMPRVVYLKIYKKLRCIKEKRYE